MKDHEPANKTSWRLVHMDSINYDSVLISTNINSVCCSILQSLARED